MDFLEVHSWTPFSLCTLYLRKFIYSDEFKYKFYASSLFVAQVRGLSYKYKLLTHHVVTTVWITDISNSVCPKPNSGSPTSQLLYPPAPLLGSSISTDPGTQANALGVTLVSPPSIGIHRQVLVILPRES